MDRSYLDYCSSQHPFSANMHTPDIFHLLEGLTIVAGRTPRKLRYAWLKNPPHLPRHLGGFRTALCREANKMMGKEISAKCWVEIHDARGRYAIEMEVRSALLNVADVMKVNRTLRSRIQNFRKAYDSTVADGEAGRHAQELLSKDLDKDWWLRLELAEKKLSQELDRCGRPDHIAGENPWDVWVQAVATSLEEDGFKVSAFSYESLEDSRPPTPFVRLIASLQADLPEWLGQHEPTRAGHPWLTLSKGVQRALEKRRQTETG
jgi:hypothetical protein